MSVCLSVCQSVSEGNAPGGTRRPRPAVRKCMEPGELTETHVCMRVCITVHKGDLYQQLDGAAGLGDSHAHVLVTGEAGNQETADG